MERDDILHRRDPKTMGENHDNDFAFKQNHCTVLLKIFFEDIHLNNKKICLLIYKYTEGQNMNKTFETIQYISYP